MDVFFISFRESNCESNWQQLLKFHPNAIRIHGVLGIDKVHVLADKLCTTDYFWTVDGDNWVTEELVFYNPMNDLTMFKAIDPITNDTTLLGGVKLWKKGSIINPSMNKGDFSLNATSNKLVLEQTFSITKYNHSPYDAWKTAFRHCVKLQSVIFKNRPGARNLEKYLQHWESCEFSEELNAGWAWQGFKDSKVFVAQHGEDFDQLNNINDYKWLQGYYKGLHGTY